MSNANPINRTNRLLIDAPLTPIQSDRFQPTGFPDIGAAVYERPDGVRMLLVESAQSMANRLEAVCLDGGGPEIIPELDGLPYVTAQLEGNKPASDKDKNATIPVKTYTSSLIEAHRLNSPFIITDKEFQATFLDESGYKPGEPMDWPKIAAAVFRYDPNSLIHGLFMANLGDGRLRLPRALTGFIEAENIREAVSGGVKNNAFDPTGKIRAADFDKDVYGNVPYHRTEYTAEKVTAFFNLDLGLLRGYKLPQPALDLLINLALYKIRRFLDGGLRLRTACDLMVDGDLNIRQPAGWTMPGQSDLRGAVQQGIRTCADQGLFADPPVTRLTTKVVYKAK